MITLYAAVGSCSLCAHVVLEELGVDYEAKFVTLRAQNSPLLDANPLGKVPTLLLEDGEVITQSSVVLPYLGDLDPSRRLLPASGPARREVLQWLGFFNSDVHLALKMIVGAGRYCADPQGMRASFEAIVKPYFSRIDATLADRPWLTGENLTIADTYAGAAYGWAKQVELDLETYPNYRRFSDAFESRQTVQRARLAEASCGVPTSAN